GPIFLEFVDRVSLSIGKRNQEGVEALWIGQRSLRETALVDLLPEGLEGVACIRPGWIHISEDSLINGMGHVRVHHFAETSSNRWSRRKSRQCWRRSRKHRCLAAPDCLSGSVLGNKSSNVRLSGLGDPAELSIRQAFDQGELAGFLWVGHNRILCVMRPDA